MASRLLLALAQLNPVVGDVAGNAVRLMAAWKQAAEKRADLLLTSELYLCGYPPEDLATKPSFLETLKQAVQDIARQTQNGPAILLGTPWRDGGRLRNAQLLLQGGQIRATVFKHDLPNYGPFDEKRIFSAAELGGVVEFSGIKLGVLICEDLWKPTVANHLAQTGAEILVVPNGSPYETDKITEREAVARARVAETGLPLVYLNQVGGQDELVFDGASFVMNTEGQVVQRLKTWQEDLGFVDIPHFGGNAAPSVAVAPAESIYHALMLGLRDYVSKNGFPGVVLGLSGGIDSAVVAALAVDALGADKVWCVMMPSPYTSRDSFEDAEALARHLGCRYDILPIESAMQAFNGTLSGVFAGRAPDVTEENIQARCRGLLLMGISNKFGPMVVSTGNKSEMSVGYSTLYGDLCGGYAVLKDVYKTEVYNIARWRNLHKPADALGPGGAPIPERILTKAPTAELRPNQKDQDSLPPYDELDSILSGLIEKDMGVHELVAKGFAEETVRRVWGMLDRAEYKRRQAPPGVKITRRILGKDRRYPITNRYRD